MYIGELRSPENLKDTQGLPKDLIPLYQSTLKSNPAQRPTGNFNVQCLGLLPWGSYQSTLKSNPAQRREGNFESFFCEMFDDFSVQGVTWLSTAHSRRMESGL